MRKQLNIDLVSKPEGGYSVANKIDLITQYREIHGCTLLQAKKDVDALVTEIEFYSKEATPNVMVLGSLLIRKIEEIKEEEDGLETLRAIDRFIFDLKHKKKLNAYELKTTRPDAYMYPEKSLKDLE